MMADDANVAAGAAVSAWFAIIICVLIMVIVALHALVQ
jgi:hypothetical protein